MGSDKVAAAFFRDNRPIRKFICMAKTDNLLLTPPHLAQLEFLQVTLSDETTLPFAGHLTSLLVLELSKGLIFSNEIELLDVHAIMLSRRSVYLLALLLSVSLLLFWHTVPVSSITQVSSTHETAPHTDVSLPKPPSTPPTPPTLNPIVLTLVLMGSPAARKGIVTIKSALMHSSRPIELHLICTEDAVAILEAPLRLVKRPYYDLKVTLHIVEPEHVKEQLRRAELSTDTGFMTKLLIHKVLQEVEKTIFVDTDMIFMVDPVQLWDTFEAVNEQTLMAFPTLGPTSHAGQVCTCVMLLNLKRMRNPRSPKPPSSNANSTFLIPTPYHPDILTTALMAGTKAGLPNMFGHPEDCMSFNPLWPPFGNQGIVYVLWVEKPYLFQDLLHRWDITHCREHYGLKLVEDPKDHTETKAMMTEEEHIQNQGWKVDGGEGSVIPGILHFNCQSDAGANVWEWPENHDGKSNTWVLMVTSIVEYKWVWLNRATASHSAHMSIVKKVGVWWLDEDKDGLVD
ncbi:hypothetical protein D9619_004872 [Psilocybe cf. subviscida]|uniref:Glycosyltransferase family 8 protein n=1 Tax=Psilocybe cf. subviscida TaxID=2480587 RepID=A0A8H5BRL5_9AGAR|nr:hypothetical protein D9619_004872 [Psilocybe cf. subviscida]